MTASDIAKLLHGKRIRHGQYVALCPAHPDRTPSLSIRDGKRAVLLKCWPGCTAEQIVAAMGLSMSDLWYSDTIAPEVMERLKEERKLERMERRMDLAGFAKHVFWGPERRYYTVVERRLREEWKAMIFAMYPERKRAYDFQIRIRREGWDAIWKEYLEKDFPKDK